MRRHEALGTIWRKNNLSLGIGIVVLVLAIGLPIGSAIARNIVAATLSASPLSIPQGTSATLSWSSSNAVACSGTGFSTGGAVSGTTTVLPSETTTYSVTCEHTPSNQATATTTVTTEQASASCAHGSTLPDGCPGAPQGSVQFSRLLNTRQVVMLNIVPGSKYTNGPSTGRRAVAAAQERVVRCPLSVAISVAATAKPIRSQTQAAVTPAGRPSSRAV
jgi:hypothetical protein